MKRYAFLFLAIFFLAISEQIAFAGRKRGGARERARLERIQAYEEEEKAFVYQQALAAQQHRKEELARQQELAEQQAAEAIHQQYVEQQRQEEADMQSLATQLALEYQQKILHQQNIEQAIPIKQKFHHSALIDSSLHVNNGTTYFDVFGFRDYTEKNRPVIANDTLQNAYPALCNRLRDFQEKGLVAREMARELIARPGNNTQSVTSYKNATSNLFQAAFRENPSAYHLMMHRACHIWNECKCNADLTKN